MRTRENGLVICGVKRLMPRYMFHSCMNASDFRRSPSKMVGCCPESLLCGRAGFPPPPPAPPGLPPPPGFPPPPPGFPPPGGPKGLFSGFGAPCPPPPPGGPDPPACAFPTEEDWGFVEGGWTCVVICVVEAIKALGVKMLDAKMFPGCRFVGVGIASAIFCSSVSLSVFPAAGVWGESMSSSSDCSSGVSSLFSVPSISPQSNRGNHSSSTIRSPSSIGAGIVSLYFPFLCW